MRRALTLSLLLLACASGCSTVNQMAAGNEGREQLLHEQLPTFHRAVYWGRPQEVIDQVDPPARAGFMNREQLIGEDEQLVELNVDKVRFGQDAREATVDVIVRYFKKPTYVVQERRSQETWAFTKMDGWRYRGAEIVEENVAKGAATLRGSF